MKRFLPSGFMIFAGVLGIAAASVQTDQDVTKNRKKFDLRETILRKFLTDNHCPDREFTELFIAEADAHDLDWRLLPSLALVESGGGRVAKGNNIFGWANGKSTFTSIGEAIHHVARALSLGQAYRGKDLDGKLATFNHGTDYRAMVRDIMNQISPRRQVEAAE
ncbi:MAG: hypothetical protein ABSG41_00950 [Bryobacteraceae bacterium]|jgi:hypothetical protein